VVNKKSIRRSFIKGSPKGQSPFGRNLSLLQKERERKRVRLLNDLNQEG
jgi:hypothetical protein